SWHDSPDGSLISLATPGKSKRWPDSSTGTAISCTWHAASTPRSQPKVRSSFKEISYIHAEAYPAGEMKHGPIALIDHEMPTLAIAPRDALYDKMANNIQEVKARDGTVLAVLTEGDDQLAQIVDGPIFIPDAPPNLTPYSPPSRCSYLLTTSRCGAAATSTNPGTGQVGYRRVIFVRSAGQFWPTVLCFWPPCSLP
ncbi:Glutamine--fructose-6-phosphate aminotransferase [isomerizing], partial [Geodia barretti]